MIDYFSYSFNITIIIYAIGFLISIYALLNPNEIIFKIYNISFLIAFTFNTVALVLRTIILEHAPMASLFDSIFFYIWSIGLVASVMYFRYKEKALSIFISLPIVLCLFKAYKSPQTVQPLSPALQTIWFETHVSTSFIAYGLFTVGFSAGILYLLKSRDKAKICKFVSPLPVIEKLVYRTGAWGFFLFTISMTCGGIWAYLAWTNYFIWTPKELFSIILWLYYSTYLHARYIREWQGKRSAYMAIFGFFLVIFTYLGISLLMRSSHSF